MISAHGRDTRAATSHASSNRRRAPSARSDITGSMVVVDPVREPGHINGLYNNNGLDYFADHYLFPHSASAPSACSGKLLPLGILCGFYKIGIAWP